MVQILRQKMHIVSFAGTLVAVSAMAGFMPALAGPVTSAYGTATAANRPGVVWKTASRSTSRLKKLDTDQDGQVSKQEFLAKDLKKFHVLDANRDGSVDLSELSAPAQERSLYSTKRYMKRLDKDADGRITLEEFEVGPRARFAARDLNSDGKISSDERASRRKGSTGWFGWLTSGSTKTTPKKSRDFTFEAMLAKTKSEFKKRDANADGAIDEAEAGKDIAERAERSTKRAMHRTDTDKDGRLTEAEYTAKTAARFDTLDLDSDGKITAEDLPPHQRSAWASPR